MTLEDGAEIVSGRISSAYRSSSMLGGWHLFRPSRPSDRSSGRGIGGREGQARAGLIRSGSLRSR
jgi:hypothetical protein